MIFLIGSTIGLTDYFGLTGTGLVTAGLGWMLLVFNFLISLGFVVRGLVVIGLGLIVVGLVGIEGFTDTVGLGFF